jgi:hypothetical protein
LGRHEVIPQLHVQVGEALVQSERPGHECTRLGKWVSLGGPEIRVPAHPPHAAQAGVRECVRGVLVQSELEIALSDVRKSLPRLLEPMKAALQGTPRRPLCSRERPTPNRASSVGDSCILISRTIADTISPAQHKHVL